MILHQCLWSILHQCLWSVLHQCLWSILHQCLWSILHQCLWSILHQCLWSVLQQCLWSILHQLGTQCILYMYIPSSLLLFSFSSPSLLLPQTLSNLLSTIVKHISPSCRDNEAVGVATYFVRSVVRVWSMCELEASNLPSASLSSSRRQR